MSRIDDLIQELCPSGVEYKQLGDVGTVVRGKRFVKDDMIDAGVPCVHYGEIYTKYGISAVQSISYVSHERARTLRFAQQGDVIMASAGETIEDIGKSVAWLGSEPIAIHDACYAFSSSMDPKFVSYFFASRSFRDQIRRSISSSKISSISTQNVAKARIPVPPLEVQREIVRVLDKFTQLEAELEAELEARRVQYEHYRRDLLGSGGAASNRMIPLGEIFEMRAGTHIKAAEISDVPTEEKLYPCYGGNGLRGYVSSYNYDQSVILVGRQGALCGNVHRAEGKIYATEHAVVVTPKVPVDMSWAFHKLTEMDLNQYKTRSAQPGLAVGRVKQVEAQYVPVDNQHRNGEVLDKLDALINDLTSGLPAELAARRKQYEHYRDRLLTFKELAS